MRHYRSRLIRHRTVRYYEVRLQRLFAKVRAPSCNLFTISFHFCHHLPLSFFQLLFYRSDFIFLKILFLWSAPAQSKSPLSKQRFRRYIVVNIDFLSLQRSMECKFEKPLTSEQRREPYNKLIPHNRELMQLQPSKTRILHLQYSFWYISSPVMRRIRRGISLLSKKSTQVDDFLFLLLN